MTAAEDDVIRRVLAEEVKTIAMVGASLKPQRPSHQVMEYLLLAGYRVIPVNPGPSQILDQPAYGSLASAPGPYQMVDIFRRTEAVGGIVDEAIRLKDEKGIKVIWTQLGVIDEEAAERARKAGLTVIMDRCPKIEYRRLGLSFQGR